MANTSAPHAWESTTKKRHKRPRQSGTQSGTQGQASCLVGWVARTTRTTGVMTLGTLVACTSQDSGRELVVTPMRFGGSTNKAWSATQLGLRSMYYNGIGLTA